jgi:hypothetical protein
MESFGLTQQVVDAGLLALRLKRPASALLLGQPLALGLLQLRLALDAPGSAADSALPDLLFAKDDDGGSDLAQAPLQTLAGLILPGGRIRLRTPRPSLFRTQTPKSTRTISSMRFRFWTTQESRLSQAMSFRGGATSSGPVPTCFTPRTGPGFIVSCRRPFSTASHGVGPM